METPIEDNGCACSNVENMLAVRMPINEKISPNY
jgi:hypothetical protein